MLINFSLLVLKMHVSGRYKIHIHFCKIFELKNLEIFSQKDNKYYHCKYFIQMNECMQNTYIYCTYRMCSKYLQYLFRLF